MLYRCNLFVHFTCETLRSLLCHLGRVHKNDSGFHVLCGIDGCARTYTNFFSLRNHFTRKHGAILNGEQVQNDGDEPRLGDQDEGRNGMDDEDAPGHEPFNFEREIEANKNALCLMQIKDEGKIPQTVVESVIRNTTQIVDNSVDLLKSGLVQCLDNAGLRMEDIPGVSGKMFLAGHLSVLKCNQNNFYLRNFLFMIRSCQSSLCYTSSQRF